MNSRRFVVTAATVVAVLGAATGCSSGSGPSAAVRTLRSDTLTVSQAAADRDRAGALAALTQLRTDLAALRSQLPAPKYRRIEAAVNALAPRLRALPISSTTSGSASSSSRSAPTTPAPSSTPKTTPTSGPPSTSHTPPSSPSSPTSSSQSTSTSSSATGPAPPTNTGTQSKSNGPGNGTDPGSRESPAYPADP